MRTVYCKYQILLNIFVGFFAILITSCTDKIEDLYSVKKEAVVVKNSDLETSVINVNANIAMHGMPITSLDGTPTRSVSLDNELLPYPDKDNLKVKIFLVHVDNADKNKPFKAEDFTDNTKQFSNICFDGNSKHISLAVADLQWDKVWKEDNTIKAFTTQRDFNFTWLYDSSDIEPGKGDWYACGIVGGHSDESANPANINDEYLKEKAARLYKFLVNFNPNDDNSTHNTYDKKGNLLADIPYSTGWTKVEVKGVNKINIKNWIFKPLGVLLKFRIRRNEKLVKPQGHNYTFASSQLSGNGGFLMCPLETIVDKRAKEEKDFGLDCELRLNTSGKPKQIQSQWYWQYENDIQPYVWETNDKKQSHGDYEWHYTYNSLKMREKAKKTGKQLDSNYDEFYVWGMPINDGYKNILRHQSCIFAEKGGFMLGMRFKNRKTGKYNYADEWLVDSRSAKDVESSEAIPNVNIQDKDGVYYNQIELGVVRPNFREREDRHGKHNLPKYPWPNPLERLARTNLANKKINNHDNWTFEDDLSSYNSNNNIEGTKIWNGANLIGIMKGHCYPQGYHIPSNYEWGIAFFNIIDNPRTRKLPDKSLGFIGRGTNIDNELRDAPSPYFEVFDPVEDYKDYVFCAGEPRMINSYLLDSKFKLEDDINKQIPMWLSYFVKNKTKHEIYAIRFEPPYEYNIDNKTYNDYKAEIIKDTAKIRKYGRRYRCAFRYHFLDVNGEKARMIIQSRWIGNASININQLKNDDWWGELGESNPLYNVDCYRVLPRVGDLYKGDCAYYTRVRYGFKDPKVSKWDKEFSISYNRIFCNRRFSQWGINRGHWENDYCLPIRLVVDVDASEYGKDAPRSWKKNGKDIELNYLK